MRYGMLITVTALSLNLLGCGGGGPLGGPDDALARVGEEYVTEGDFRQVFETLSPEDQVAVLDPGGRMGLLDRIVQKKLLEIATAGAEIPERDWWTSIYRDASLAESYTGTLLAEARMQASDTTSRLDEGWFELSIVLVDDSSTASDLAADWEASGPFEPDTSVMMLAPWSEGSSSFRVLENYIELMPVYLSDLVLEHIDEGAQAAPMFGEYVVFTVTTREPERPMRTESAVPARLSDLIYRGAEIEPRSREIHRFAQSLSIIGNHYVAEETEFNPGDTLVAYSEGAITAGEAAHFINRLHRNNFLSEPAELGRLLAPTPAAGDRGVAVWMYVTGMAKIRWEAARAAEEGIEVDSGLLSMAEVESFLRLRVIEELAAVDAATLDSFYNANLERYTVPERRSVIRADIPVSDTIAISNLADLGELEVQGDSALHMSVSPLLPEGAFGPLGEEVFAADTTGVHGPLVLSDSLPLVYFQVIQVEPERVRELSEVLDRVQNDYVALNASARMDQLLMELRREYDVEIDSTAVREVDPW